VPTPEAGIALRQHADQVKRALQPDLTGGVYMNFLDGEESRQRVRQGYTPAAYPRLTTLKSVYDGENRLAYAFNITPA
jgi:hypothetical protein